MGDITLRVDGPPSRPTRQVQDLIAFEIEVLVEDVCEGLVGLFFAACNHLESFDVPRIHFSNLGQSAFVIVGNCDTGQLGAKKHLIDANGTWLLRTRGIILATSRLNSCRFDEFRIGILQHEFFLLWHVPICFE